MGDPFCLTFCLLLTTSVVIRPAFTVSPDHPNPEALRLGRVMLSLTILAKYGLIRLSDKLLPISLQGYTEVLWHSWIVPACLSDSPLFNSLSLTGCHHPYAGRCTRCPRLLLPWYHWPSQSLDSLGTFIFIHFNRLHVEGSHDAVMFASRCGPRCCSAPVPTWTLHFGKAQRASYIRASLEFVTSS